MIMTDSYLSVYTFAVYMGSSIYVPSTAALVREFNVSITVVSLGLALYV